MREQPLVSVFIPYYNDEKFLRQSIESVLNQTYQNWELILFNHASTDNSRNIAHSYKDKRIKHIDAEENLGAGSGYNIKISLSEMRGKYLKLFCADDMLKSDCLEKLVNHLEKNPSKDICFSNMDYVDEQGISLNTTWYDDVPMADCCSDEKSTLLKFFHGYSHIAYPAALIKMDVIKNISLDTSLIMLFDVSLWVKLLINGAKIMFCPSSTIDYRISDNQMSSKVNLNKAVKIGNLELYQILDLYYQIKDVDLIKYLCPCEFAEMLSENDVKFIPFIISYYFASVWKNGCYKLFKDQQVAREIFGTTRLYYLLRNEEMSRQIKDKFNFGIKEFRDIYSWKGENEESIYHHILGKPVGKLSLIQMILFIPMRLFKGIWNIPNKIKKIINKENRKEQKYTV